MWFLNNVLQRTSTHTADAPPGPLHLGALEAQVVVEVEQEHFPVTAGKNAVKEGMRRDVVGSMAARLLKVKMKGMSVSEHGGATVGMRGIPCLASHVIVMSLFRVRQDLGGSCDKQRKLNSPLH